MLLAMFSGYVLRIDWKHSQQKHSQNIARLAMFWLCFGVAMFSAAEEVRVRDCDASPLRPSCPLIIACIDGRYRATMASFHARYRINLASVCGRHHTTKASVNSHYRFLMASVYDRHRTITASVYSRYRPIMALLYGRYHTIMASVPPQRARCKSAIAVVLS